MINSKILLGSWITLNHPSIAEIMADTGFDWLCIDMEHSVTDYSEAQLLIMAIQSKGLKAYVRVGNNNARIIKRVLDAGADGIIVPSVNSAVEAKLAVDSVKYPPMGKRGVGLARAQGYGFDFENYRDITSKEIKLIVQIEHINAIKELDAIISTEGIDGTFIGPYDLSGSMGKPGEYNDKDVLEALASYELIAKKYNKWIGYHVVQPEFNLVEDKIAAGYNFIAFSFDAYFLGNSIRKELSKRKK
ncbi:MAG: aldolase/citrate lyase family protein [Candidatus Pedobacter colombiensis]|uniref:Aldolase/citrate lyase family protein n=1 Tax=Candidatus Pedobacter colombiensis TaxID=3121371 RepID=A0AAJ5W7R4_9SPHI|nr:aldolase/citrate lyase family protein [Pedobacter sp.]WEK19656.1 MAG: aldolase/citrate lyase family protein [Pedobacter sp.]